MTESERYAAGRRVLSTMLGEAAAEAAAKKMRTLHPEFERLVMEHVMHDLYGRDGLDIKTRLLCTIAALTVLGKPEQLAVHIDRALGCGSTRTEIEGGHVADERFRRISGDVGCTDRSSRTEPRGIAWGFWVRRTG